MEASCRELVANRETIKPPCCLTIARGYDSLAMWASHTERQEVAQALDSKSALPLGEREEGKGSWGEGRSVEGQNGGERASQTEKRCFFEGTKLGRY